MDCEDDTEGGGSEVCIAFGVDEYPTLYYGDPSSPEIYEGDYDYDSLAAFAKEHISKPPCTVSNMDYCDDETKTIINDLRNSKSKEELEKMEAEVLEQVEKENDIFDKEAAKLRQQYEDLVSSLNTKVDKIRKDSNFKWVQQILNELDHEQQQQQQNGKDDEL